MLHIYSPDGYLFEFKSPPGGIEAANDKARFEAAIRGMTSVSVRHSFSLLLNGISAQVLDEHELDQLKDMDFMKLVTPLVNIFLVLFCNTRRKERKKKGRNMHGAVNHGPIPRIQRNMFSICVLTLSFSFLDNCPGV